MGFQVFIALISGSGIASFFSICVSSGPTDGVGVGVGVVLPYIVRFYLCLHLVMIESRMFDDSVCLIGVSSHLLLGNLGWVMFPTTRHHYPITRSILLQRDVLRHTIYSRRYGLMMPVPFIPHFVSVILYSTIP